MHLKHLANSFNNIYPIHQLRNAYADIHLEIVYELYDDLVGGQHYL